MRTQLLLLLTAAVLPARVVSPPNEFDESKVIRQLERLGGKVERDETLPTRPVVRVSVIGTDFTNADLELLTLFKDLKVLYANRTKVSDGGLVHLKRLTNLTTLYLGDT